MKQKHKPGVKVKSKKEVRTKPNKVYGKDWLFSGQSKGFPKLLDIRYEKDLKFQKSQKKKRSKKGGKIKKSKRGGKVK